ncbi:MAG: ORF6N domain-containing protein [Bacteroidetes bacterium]|nr:ORF6N domain-containing protein [Bacteroidota bacterium]
MELQILTKQILEIRGHKVMLDFHLANLYEVETRALKQAVKRNIERFPSDFMFQLTDIEAKELVSQNVIPSKSYLGGYLPYAFTEQGVAMLSSVLKSKKALEVNISIMRAFVVIRQYYMNYTELKLQIEKLEKDMNLKFNDVYEALKYLIEPPQTPRKQIGYKTNDE